MGVLDLIDDVCAVGVVLVDVFGLVLVEDGCFVGAVGCASASEVVGDSAATTMRRRFASDFRGRLMRAGVDGAVEGGAATDVGVGEPRFGSEAVTRTSGNSVADEDAETTGVETPS